MKRTSAPEKLYKERKQEAARRAREIKKKEIDAVMVKEKIENLGDFIAVLNGLTKKDMECAAIYRIRELHALGFSPAEIMQMMKYKRKQS